MEGQLGSACGYLDRASLSECPAASVRSRMHRPRPQSGLKRLHVGPPCGSDPWGKDGSVRSNVHLSRSRRPTLQYTLYSGSILALIFSVPILRIPRPDMYTLDLEQPGSRGLFSRQIQYTLRMFDFSSRYGNDPISQHARGSLDNLNCDA